MQASKIKDYKDYPDSFLTEVSDAEMTGATSHTKLTAMTFDDKGNTAGEKPPPGADETKQEGAGRLSIEGLVDGRLMLDIVDGLLAAIVVWIVALFLYEVKRKDMRLTESEKDILDPIVDKCLATINWNFENAWALLGVSLIFIYAGKAVDTAVKKPKKDKKPNTGGKVNDATVTDLNPDDVDPDEVKKKQYGNMKVDPDLVTDYHASATANQEPKEISYTPDELKEMSRMRHETVGRLKKKLAGANSKKGIKTIFLARER